MRPSFFVSISAIISNKRFRKWLIYAVCKVVVILAALFMGDRALWEGPKFIFEAENLISVVDWQVCIAAERVHQQIPDVLQQYLGARLFPQIV